MLNVFVIVGCCRFAEGTRVLGSDRFAIAFGNNSRRVTNACNGLFGKEDLERRTNPCLLFISPEPFEIKFVAEQHEHEFIARHTQALRIAVDGIEIGKCHVETVLLSDAVGDEHSIGPFEIVRQALVILRDKNGSRL